MLGQYSIFINMSKYSKESTYYYFFLFNYYSLVLVPAIVSPRVWNQQGTFETELRYLYFMIIIWFGLL